MRKIIDFFANQKPYFWIFAVVTALAQCTAYWLPDLLARDEYHLLGSAFDDRTPVLPGFIYIYVGAFFFWFGAYAYYYGKGIALAKRVLTADIFCKTVGFVVYCLYPCTLRQVAPEEISGFGAWLMKLIYLADRPSKLLPSMHCFVSILLALPVFYRGAQPVPTVLKIFFPLMALAVCASTLFVKQHVFVDVYSAAALALVGWGVSLLFWRLIDAKRQERLETPV